MVWQNLLSNMAHLKVLSYSNDLLNVDTLANTSLHTLEIRYSSCFPSEILSLVKSLHKSLKSLTFGLTVDKFSFNI